MNVHLGASAGVVLLLASLTACSPQKLYYGAELSAAADAARAGNVAKAESHYASAVWRAKNHLGDKEIATALYDLGNFQRQSGRFKESTATLEESIAYAKKAGGFDDLAMGRRYVELSAAYAELGDWDKGLTFLRLVVPYWQRYQGQEQATVSRAFEVYRVHLVAAGRDPNVLPNPSSSGPSPN